MKAPKRANRHGQGLAVRPEKAEETPRAFFTAWDVALLAFLLYLRTLAPSVATIFDDSLEFQVVVPLLGVPHPPGYPLYTLLGKVWTLIVPWGDPAWRLNLLSAIAAALALGVLGEATRLLVKERWAVAAAVALFAISPTFWRQATIAEVYTLHALLLSAVLFFALRWVTTSSPSRNALWGMALFLGLGLTHHRMILLMIPSLALGLAVRRQHLPRDRKTWAALSALALAPLLLYAYIPLIGARVGSLDGTYTNTWSGFWDWVLARAYRVFIVGNPFGVHRTLLDYVRLYVAEIGWAALPLAFLGLARLLKQRPRALGAILAPALVLHAAFVAVYKVADIEVFFLSLTLLTVPLIAAGLVFAATTLRHLLERGLPAGQAATLVAIASILAITLVPPVLGRVQAWEKLNRADDWQVYDYGLDIVQQPLPEGSVIVGILGETTLVRYFRDVLGYRPDLVVVPADREEARHKAIARWLRRGRGVFITRPLAAAAERYSLDAWGPLIRVWPKGQDDRPRPEIQVGEPFTPAIVLAGYTLTERPTHAGPVLRVTLFWDVQGRPREAYKVSARLVRADGQVLYAVDSVPVHNTYPTPFWTPGERVVDVYDLPRGKEKGSQVLIILYREADAGEVHRTVFPAP